MVDLFTLAQQCTWVVVAKKSYLLARAHHTHAKSMNRALFGGLVYKLSQEQLLDRLSRPVRENVPSQHFNLHPNKEKRRGVQSDDVPKIRNITLFRKDKSRQRSQSAGSRRLTWKVHRRVVKVDGEAVSLIRYLNHDIVLPPFAPTGQLLRFTHRGRYVFVRTRELLSVWLKVPEAAIPREHVYVGIKYTSDRTKDDPRHHNDPYGAKRAMVESLQRMHVLNVDSVQWHMVLFAPRQR